MMNINIFDSYNEMSRGTAEFVQDFVGVKPESILCFPAGDTATGTFRFLEDADKKCRNDFKSCIFVGLDEWVGMGKEDEGGCKYFMYKNLFEPLAIEEKKIVFFDACAKDLSEECKHVDSFLASNGPVDLMLAGIGMNGHIGLNEPGVSFELYSHVIELSPITKNVAQKYFSSERKLEKGITLGMKHVMQARTVILIASGANKAEIVKKAVEGEITNQVPASILQKHPNCHVFLDNAAASRLKSQTTGI